MASSSTRLGHYPPAPSTSPVRAAITTNADAAISLVLGGSNGLIKLGAGTLTLTGANNYFGPTSVVNGTLAVTGAGSLANTPA